MQPRSYNHPHPRGHLKQPRMLISRSLRACQGALVRYDTLVRFGRTTNLTTSAAARQAAPDLDEEVVHLVTGGYTHEKNADYWQTRPVTVASRLAEVGASLGVWLAGGLASGATGISTDAKRRAGRLNEILTRLGPAYIKIGQAVSSRPDVLSPDMLTELEKLQDQLPPFSTDEALRVIEEEYGRPYQSVFREISSSPVAAASLGQVYKGVLRDTDETVAIKVQRPGVATSISLDVLVLRRLAKEVRKWRKLNTNLPLLIDEWAASLFKELDYRQEARNGIKFKELYSHLEGVYVPGMYPELTTRRVLVMEWIDGERLHTNGALAKSATYDLSDEIRLVEVGVRCSLEQLLEYGFYHADPHPGNLLRTKDGKLAYLDFGMMGEVDEKIRQGLIQATLHLVNREYQSLADDFITLGMLPEDSDREQIVPALTSVFAKALEGGVNNLSFGDLSGNLGRTMYQYKFQIPSYYTLLVRSLSVLEGIALASQPDYKVLSAAYPWIARRLLTDTTPELQQTLRSLVYDKTGNLNFKRLESLFTQATRSTGLPQRARDAPEGAPAPRGDALALILSSQGSFVRGIVVNELGKGADALWRVSFDDAVAEVSSSAWSGTVSAPFLAELANLSMSTDNDRRQLDGLMRLATVLRDTSSAEGYGMLGSSAEARPQQTPCATIEEALNALDWLVREYQTLTPEERQRALQIPLDIGRNASERVGARALRWWFKTRQGDDDASKRPTPNGSP